MSAAPLAPALLLPVLLRLLLFFSHFRSFYLILSLNDVALYTPF